MDFFKVRRFRKAHKPNPEGCNEDNPVQPPDELKNDQDNATGKSVDPDASADGDEDDDDFITNEVKRRLKELRRNSFMMLIPEESGLEGEEEDEGAETCSSDGRDADSQGQHVYYDFEAIHQKYCERMLFFDRMSFQCLNEAGPQQFENPSPKYSSKKLTSPFRCLSLKKMEESQDETEHLQEPDNGPYENLETAYVAHVCLSWEALHCQYTQLIQKISCQPDNSACYNHCAQQYQQFQVLLQRFIENEPFELGSRPEIYARTKSSMTKLLQVPNVQGSYRTASEGEDSDYVILAPDLLALIQGSILSFHLFLKRDKKKSGGVLNLFGSQNQAGTPIQQVHSMVEKKKLKLKELRKKKKGWKKNLWPGTHDDVELLLCLIDVRVVSRVLRMVKITQDQLLWCDNKIRKLDVLEGKLQRDPCPILFPC